MKIGLLSDIHGDPTAFDLALALLRRQRVDEIICAGDLAEKGPDTNSVVAWMQAAALPCVRGNHDTAVIQNQAWLREWGDLDNPVLQARLMSGDTLTYLEGLPKTLSFDWENRRILLAHGSPWSSSIYVFPTSRPALFHRVMISAGADIVILGHTHLPMQLSCHLNGNTVQIFNPGSVCGPHSSGSHTCAILTLPESSFQVFDLRTGAPHTLRCALI